ELVQREDVKVIIPQTTREIVTLSQHKDHFNNLGSGVIVSEYKCLTEANDKFTLLARAKEIGIPYPSFVLTQSEAEFVTAVKSFGYPENKVVIKPPVSNGMRGLRILSSDPWNVKRFLNEKPDGS